MARLNTRGERWELTRNDREYPEGLLSLEEPPTVLYGTGSRKVLADLGLGIIGARKATPYGLAASSMAGRIAAESDITVVSGGALGCDSAAARAALDAGGKTIVVSGVGADLIYPRSSEDVFHRAIDGGGAVISVAPWGSEPQPWSFPKRNPIIAALSHAVLVAEAGSRSGTMSTATAAFEMGREVYAVPGSIFSPESQGANSLIRDGAHIIACEQDLEMLISRDFGVLRMVMERPASARGRVLSALFAMPMRADDLAHSLGETPLDIMRKLADLEVRGCVMRLPDGRYAPTKEVLEDGGIIGGPVD